VSVNKYRNHVVVIPEDDVNRQVMNGFLLHQSLKPRSIDVRPPAGGWKKVLNADLPGLWSLNCRYFILLVDFDRDFKRRKRYFEEQFPVEVRNRVYLIGCLSEPENFKKNCGLTYEEIGTALAESCIKQEGGLWNHDELAHNKDELERLMRNVRPILFG